MRYCRFLDGAFIYGYCHVTTSTNQNMPRHATSYEPDDVSLQNSAFDILSARLSPASIRLLVCLIADTGISASALWLLPRGPCDRTEIVFSPVTRTQRNICLPRFLPQRSYENYDPHVVKSSKRSFANVMSKFSSEAILIFKHRLNTFRSL